VSDGVDAAVNGVQPARAQSVVDCRAAETQPDQLPAGDDSVLTNRQIGDSAIRWA